MSECISIDSSYDCITPVSTVGSFYEPPRQNQGFVDIIKNFSSNSNMSRESRTEETTVRIEFINQYTSLLDEYRSNFKLNNNKELSLIKNFYTLTESHSDVPDNVFKDAREVLTQFILFPSIPTPRLSIIDEDEFNFYINSDELILDIAVFGDSTYSFYFKDKLNNREKWSDVGIDTSLIEIMDI
ncbi:TPA: hypothetical protein NJ169_002388 [Vibrio parahaemolyticus]|nr:hypothetical protein [Vibrio parahaemolyticus]